MAMWQITVSALELVGEDKNHWIQTRIVESVYKVQENSIIRLYKSLQEHIEKESPQVLDFCVTYYTRIDKNTGKQYGLIDERNPEELGVSLSSSKYAQAISDLQANIFRKLKIQEPIDSAENLYRMLGYRNSIILHLDRETAYISGNGYEEERFLSHEFAQKEIKALQKFYDLITPNELEVLNINSKHVTHKEIEMLREFGIKVTNSN